MLSYSKNEIWYYKKGDGYMKSILAICNLFCAIQLAINGDVIYLTQSSIQDSDSYLCTENNIKNEEFVTSYDVNNTKQNNILNKTDIEEFDIADTLDANNTVINNAEIDLTLQCINERVSWIINNRGKRTFRSNNGLDDVFDGLFTYIDDKPYDDYYYGINLVYREGDISYYDIIEGPIFYHLFYDINEKLVFAKVIQYRYHTYAIYFQNDRVICFMRGDRFEGKIIDNESLDDIEINAINVCLGNAYK